MKSIGKQVRHLAMLAAAAVGAACGTDPGPGPGGDGAIAISVVPATLTIEQGGSGSVAATITRSGGFTGAVTIVTEGAPAGVTATVANVTTSGTTTSGTVNVAVAASVAPGTYPLTIRATGSGVTAQTVALSLVVTAAPAIALSAVPPSVTIARGASGTSTITIARTNFTGAVTLTLEGAPAGVTGTFDPAPGTGTTSVLTLQVGASVAPGTYPLTVRGTGTGVAAATTAVSLVVPAPVEGSFDITTIAPDPKTIAQGGSGDVTVTLTRSNFTGAVDLTLENAPTGVTGSFAPASATGTSSVLTLAVGATAAAGNHTLTVRGTGTGVAAKTRDFVLTITELAQGSFTISLGSTAVTVQQSAGIVNVPVTINRTNFTGSIALAVSGTLPTGFTATLTPTSTTGTTATLALSATTAVTPGSVQLSVAGTATGAPSASSPQLTATVTAASGGGGNVSLDYSACEITERPIWFAYQNGSGPWTRVTPNGNVYSFNISESKGGIAAVTSDGGGAAVSIFYFSQAEFLGMASARFCGTSEAGKSVLVTTQNVAPTQVATLSLGGGVGTANFAAPIATVTGVANGTFDLIGYAKNPLVAGGGDRMAIRRGVNTAAIADGGSAGSPVDFLDALESFSPAVATVAVNGLQAMESVTFHSMSYSTGASCTQGSLYTSLGGGSSLTAYGVPAAKQLGTDYHNLFVQTSDGSSIFRTVFQSFQALGNRTVDLPPVLSVSASNVTGGAPYKIIRLAFALPTSLGVAAAASFSDIAGSSVAVIAATSGWLGGPNADLAVPDFSGLAGWDNTWMAAPGATVRWSASASGHSSVDNCAAANFLSSAKFGEI